MKRRFSLLLALPALLSACVPTSLQTRPTSEVTLTAQLGDELRVETGQYRRPGPAQLRVQVSAPAPTYLYALLVPEQRAAQLLTPQPQPVQPAQSASFNLPEVSGYTQLFIVGSLQPLTFGPLGSGVEAASKALSAATADAPPNSWNVTTQVYRVGQYGALKVVSDPPDVNVYVNGSYRGTTPLVLGAVPAGNVTLRLERPGFEPLSRTVAVVADQTVQVQVRLHLRPAVGQLTVRSSVPAQVQLLGPQGEWHGPAPLLNAELPAGDYDLTVTPQDPSLKAAWLGFTLKRDQNLNVSCAPDGGRLNCQVQ
ncbi:hypothetical protein DKM44_10685 [Deinococcus irradiatisoli]|uniref:PEGA domain-containing protein n=1 Tax=Deinococcus irradiatisoli TaxID=2202254 RepID=A0A2Z3JQC3_9DEIO|nr:PEGA domain-containing protein [Deinococcus irradiatisoli]AWN23638.1 hypothetical protein DKM44_10685 [Deinococcus irradiatisoli]